MRQAAGLRCLLVLLLGLHGCASEATRQAAHDRQVAQLRQRWQQADDADSLAAAALLIDGEMLAPAQRLALLERALAQASDRFDFRWQQAQLCLEVSGCDAKAAIDALQALDPDNAAPAVLRLHRPFDEATLQATLDTLGNAKRFDLRHTRTVARFMRTLLASGEYRPFAALGVAVNSTLKIPPFQDLMQACRAPANDAPARQVTCRRIATTLRTSDTYLVEVLGLTLARHNWPADSAERADAERALRIARYRMKRWAELSLRRWSSAYALGQLQLYESQPSEQAVIRASLVRAHVDPEPPPGWTSDYPGDEATGRRDPAAPVAIRRGAAAK